MRTLQVKLTLYGVLAQLVERMVCNHKVKGLITLSETNHLKNQYQQVLKIRDIEEQVNLIKPNGLVILGSNPIVPLGGMGSFRYFQQTKDLCITKLLRLSSSPKRKRPTDDIKLSRIIREDYEGSIPHKSRWSVWSGVLVEELSLVAVGNMLQHMEKILE